MSWPKPVTDDSPNRDQVGPSQPRELGKIRWLRGLDKIQAQAKKANRPVLLLFQEVPG